MPKGINRMILQPLAIWSQFWPLRMPPGMPDRSSLRNLLRLRNVQMFVQRHQKSVEFKPPKCSLFIVILWKKPTKPQNNKQKTKKYIKQYQACWFSHRMCNISWVSESSLWIFPSSAFSLSSPKPAEGKTRRWAVVPFPTLLVSSTPPYSSLAEQIFPAVYAIVAEKLVQYPILI